jgi:ribosome-binding protein aMBF1 (putative translation factor)
MCGLCGAILNGHGTHVTVHSTLLYVCRGCGGSAAETVPIGSREVKEKRSKKAIAAISTSTAATQ